MSSQTVSKPMLKSPGSAASLAVVRADLERDREAILGVWQRNLSSQAPELQRARYDWYYRRCPNGPGRCWLLVARPADQVVGAAGLGLRRIRIGSRTVRAGHSSDFCVDEPYRVLFPAMKLGRAALACLSDDLELIYTLPNELSIGVLCRMGYQTPWQLRRYAKVLRTEPYLPRAVLPPLRRGVAAAIDFYRRLAAPESWQNGRGQRVEEITGFDGRFDELWGRCAPRFAMIGERTAEFLDWRYRQCPLQKYITLALLPGAGDRLLGYAVGYFDQDHRFEVVDFLVDEEPDAHESLVGGLLAWARRGGAVCVSCGFFGAERWELALKRLGFIMRKPGRMLTVQARADCNTDLFHDWRFSLGDEDYN